MKKISSLEIIKRSENHEYLCVHCNTFSIIFERSKDSKYYFEFRNRNIETNPNFQIECGQCFKRTLFSYGKYSTCFHYDIMWVYKNLGYLEPIDKLIEKRFLSIKFK